MTGRYLDAFASAASRLRDQSDLSLEDVATAAGFSGSYISKVLRGHRPPTPEIARKLDHALRADGELIRLAALQTDPAHTYLRPLQLPAPTSDFVGRADDLAAIDDAVATHSATGAVTIVIEGGFWTGKTELAIHWANRRQSRFPGGCLVADLRGLAAGAPARPEDTIDSFLRALGADDAELAGTLEQRTAQYRSRLAGRPAIVILDNAADYQQVKPLLPGPGSVALITSREHQATLLARHAGLHLDLAPLPMADALDLLRHRIGGSRVNANLDDAETLVRRAGRLPMAILIAADHLIHDARSMRAVIERLDTVDNRLAFFSTTDPTASLYQVLDLSYLALPSRTARVLRLLGTSPATIVSPDSAAALTGLPITTAGDALDELRRAHLIDHTADHRFRLNPLVSAYAHQRATRTETFREINDSGRHLLQWYATAVARAISAILPGWAGEHVLPHNDPASGEPTLDDYHHARRWLDTEAPTILHLARTDPTDLGWALPAAMLP